MRVWLAWTGNYSDAEVRGVYSSLALAQEAARLINGYVGDADGYEIDGDADHVRAGLSRWRIYITVEDGEIWWTNLDTLATGVSTSVEPFTPHGSSKRSLEIACDARDKDHAVKIAGDERAKYLAALPVSRR